jgi:hypothetical protein
MEEKKFYELHRSTVINALLKFEKTPRQHTNLKMAELLEDYYPRKNRSYIVKEDDLTLEGKNIINNIMEF